MSTILVVAAHPDDEVLGCGGTIARHVASGDAVHVLFLSDGESARGEATGENVKKRKCQARAAAAILGAKEPLFETFPDNALDTVSLIEVVTTVEKHLADIEPEILLTHHGNDLNIDHRIAHSAVLTACRPQPEKRVRAIYTFEIPSSTNWSSPDLPGFAPKRFINIAPYLKKKRDALRCYIDEIREFPHERSFEAVDALAKWRGASVGVPAAEAFGIVREIVT